jgi:phosphoglycolate phosphatase-like HAD superfamily hydrolase
MNYIDNIRGCLIKYGDLESTHKWVQKALNDLSSDQHQEFITELNEVSVQTDDKYASQIFFSICKANLSSLVIFTVNKCNSEIDRAFEIVSFVDEIDLHFAASLRGEIDFFLEAQKNQRLQHEEKLKAYAEKLIQEKSEAEILKREVALAAIEKLNASRQFDLLLFDLDDTLIKSSHLAQYRGKDNIGNRSQDYLLALSHETKFLSHLIPEALLQKIKATFPDIRLGVLTRAPRAYADVLLTHCFPSINWDCVIAYEDVARTKPYPDGVYAAAKHANVLDMRRVALVGDEKTDIIAAYQSGAFAILFNHAWGADWSSKDNSKRSEHYKALELMPDAKINHPSEIVSILTNPWKYLPALESWRPKPDGDPSTCDMRLDTRNHFNNLPHEGPADWVVTKVMGRYFASHQNDSQFDFRRKSELHQLSKEILAAKDDKDYPDYWVVCCVRYISTLAEQLSRNGRDLVVCPVPARPGRYGRMERLIERISSRIGFVSNLTFEKNILHYKHGVTSNKILNQDQRFMNVRDHLEVAEPAKIVKNEVMVLDDVVTSGATLYYAD